MGCDIHLTVEKKTENISTGDQKWEAVFSSSYIRRDPVTNETLPWEDSQEWYQAHEREDVFYKDRWKHPLYLGRNYGMFAILAGVRNYDNYPVIVDPRGIPVNPSPEYTQMCAGDELDGHTHSWVTLTELLNFKGWARRDLISLRSQVHAWLDALCAIDSNTDNVRICFYFDN